MARRAGLSQGALFRHFASKAELVAAAVEHLLAGLVSEYRSVFDRAAASGDRVATTFELLWEIFQRRRLAAALEVYLVARTDADLAASLGGVVRQHRENLLRQAEELFPEAARSRKDFAARVDLLLDALVGEAVVSLASPDPERSRNVVAGLTALGRELLSAGATHSPG